MEQITVDLIPNGKMPMLHASQYDDGRQVRINLTENRQAYTLTGNEVLSLAVRKADNTLVTMDIANTYGGKSYVEFATTEQMCACAGLNFGELTITNNGTKVGSLNFYLYCEVSPEQGGVSQSEINNLARQVEELVEEDMDDYLSKDEAADTYATITDLDTLSGVVDTKASASDLETLAGVVDTKASKTYVDTELDKKADKTYVDSVADTKADKATTYTKTQTDNLVSPKADKSYVDTQLASKANSADVFDKTETNNLLNAKANASDVYTKTETDDKISAIIDDTQALENKAWSGKKTFDEIVSILPTGQASGSIANFNTSLALPLEIVADVNASGGGGTPTTPIPIVGVSAVNVTACGKNLIDYNAVSDVIYNAQLQTRKGIAIKKQAGTFTVNSNYSGTCTVYSKIHYANDTWGSANTIQNGTTITAKTSTLSAGDELIIFDADTTHTTAQTIEIFKYLICEMSASATPFEQYNGTTQIINLGGTYYGGQIEIDKDGHRRFKVTSAKYVITGNESFSTTGSGQHILSTSSELYDNMKLASDNGVVANIKCSIAKAKTYNQLNVAGTTDGIGIGINFLIIGSEQYDNWSNLVGEEITYEIKTPYYIDLTSGEPITALVGTNNVYVDSGNIAVAYKKSIDDAIAELQALILS